MSEIDPPRLDLLEGSSELSDLLRSARDCVPSDDVVSRLAANLGLPPPGGGGGGVPAAAPSAAPLASGAPAAAVSVKALAAAALITGAGIAGWLAFGTGAQDAPAPRPAVVVAAPSPVEASPPAEAPPLSVVEAPLPSAVQEVARAPTPSASARAVKPPVDKPSEVDLVGRAQKALRTDPARALALTSEHRQLYPRGTLAQEREVLAIEALGALGQGDAARARAAAFDSASPGSPYAVRVARAIKKTARVEH